MNINNQVKSQLELARSVHDFGGLNMVRQAAHSGDTNGEALKEAARQFESIFVQMLMKSMRKAQEALIDKDSPFNSEQAKFYRDMHDQQLALDLSTNGGLGLADLIIKQLGNDESYKPASTIRADGNLPLLVTRNIAAQPSSSGVERPAVASKRAAFDSPEEFIHGLLPKAQEAAQRLGIDPKALVAQAAVETGWGKFIIHGADGKSSHNLFGIKADNRWNGERVSIDTVEFVKNVPQREQASFRRYSDFAESLHDYVDFIHSNPRYQRALEQTSDPASYYRALQEAGYATDPEYANKIMSVYEGTILSELLP